MKEGKKMKVYAICMLSLTGIEIICFNVCEDKAQQTVELFKKANPNRPIWYEEYEEETLEKEN